MHLSIVSFQSLPVFLSENKTIKAGSADYHVSQHLQKERLETYGLKTPLSFTFRIVHMQNLFVNH